MGHICSSIKLQSVVIKKTKTSLLRTSAEIWYINKKKLTTTQPPTLGAASRISGVTPAAIIALLRFVKKQKNTKAA